MNKKTGRGVKPVRKVIPIRKGCIVWAPITPAKGVKKPRRSIVLMELPTPGTIGKRFLVIGVTCDGGEYNPNDTKKYPPDIYIPIPHAKDGSCATTFTLPSAAYVEFVEGFAEQELEATEGRLEDNLLDELITKIKNYLAKQTAGEP